MSRARLRKERRRLIEARHRKSVEQGRIRDTEILDGLRGQWGYGLDADQDVALRCCPQCFRAYSDYEVRATVPCRLCRSERSLESLGGLAADDHACASPLERVDPAILELYDAELREQKIEWRITELRRSVVRLIDYHAEVRSMGLVVGVKQNVQRYREDIEGARALLVLAKSDPRARSNVELAEKWQ